jgi:hypothetical protein
MRVICAEKKLALPAQKRNKADELLELTTASFHKVLTKNVWNKAFDDVEADIAAESGPRKRARRGRL